MQRSSIHTMSQTEKKMRFPGAIMKFGPRPAPFINVTIKRKNRIVGIITALIDTGSPFTAILPSDAEKLRIKVSSRRGSTVRLAGHKFMAIECPNLSIMLKSADGQLISFSNPIISILTLTSPKERKEVQEIPSIIGNDFLEENGLALFFNPAKRIAYLEKQ